MPTMSFSDCDRNQEVNSGAIIHWLRQCLISIDMPQRQHETLKKKDQRLFDWFGIFWLILDLRWTFNGADNSTRCRIVREDDYTSFSPTADTTVLFHDIVFAFLSLKLVFFGRFFFLLQCGFRALTSWRRDGIFRDLIIIVALIAFLGNTKHEQMQMWTNANPQKISVLNGTLEMISPVVHRWDRKNIRKMSRHVCSYKCNVIRSWYCLCRCALLNSCFQKIYCTTGIF